jgi:hypothetical protein
MRVLLYPCKKKKLRMPLYNVDKFVLLPSVDFFTNVAGKKSLPVSKVTFLLTCQCTFADMAVTFSLPHQQKSQ